VVTPEYNHSIPGVLKNAIDSVFVSFAFRHKPLAAVAYSAGIAGGVRAIEHLAQIAVEADMAPLRSSVIIPNSGAAFDASGAPTDPVHDIVLGITLDDLAWWADALGQARAQGEQPPAVLRLREAMSALEAARSA
jgi:NAD(P)H-dependent FMN reductase